MLRAKQQRGFTILEILITIVIIGILAAITVISYNGVQQRARTGVLEGDLLKASTALGNSKQQVGTYPSSLSAVTIDSTAGVSFTYTYTSSTDSYCLTGTNQGISRYITSTNSEPQSGSCPGGGGSTVTNLVTNPSIETDLTNISTISVTTSRALNWASSGVYSVLLTPNSASNDSFAWIGCGATQGLLCLGMQAGHTYTLSARQYIPTTLSGSLHARAATINIWQLVSGSYTPAIGGGDTTAGIHSLSVTATINPAATEAFIRLNNGATNSANNYVYYDSIMLTEGSSTYGYADGNTPNWVWNGTTNLSTSTGPPL